MTHDLESNPSSKEVKDYLDRRFGQETPFLHRIRSQSVEEGLPEIQVPIHLGKFIYLLAKIQHAQRILEIGTLGGYSTAWLAQALNSTGHLISLEMNPHHAEMAKQHLSNIQDKRIEIRVGHAIDLLSQLSEANEGPFDLIFIDADKENNVLYLDWALSLSRPGTLILIDNIIPKGQKVGYPSHDEAQAVYAFNDYIAQHPKFEVSVIPVLTGPHGRIDGLAILRLPA